MNKTWRWVAAGVAAVLILGAAGLLGTEYGRKEVRYIGRRYGWGEEGRRAEYEAAWSVAVSQYRQALGGRRIAPGTAEYQVKALLVSDKKETVARLAAGLSEPTYDETWPAFAWDLLLATDRDTARALIRSSLADVRLNWAPALYDAAKAAFTVDELRDLLPGLPSVSQGDLLSRLGGAVTRADLEGIVLNHRDGTWPVQLIDNPDGWEVLLALYPRLEAAGKIQVLQQAAIRKNPGIDRAEVLKTEQDRAVRQFLLLEMKDYPAYLASVERDGMFRGVWLSWEKESELAGRYPDSYLARGIKAYEAVRGLPYFEMARRKVDDWNLQRQYGNRQYDCDREVPGWTEFLATYGKHEGADDAAYRLGRCLEIRGEYAGALRSLAGALTAGDGEMAQQARSRIVWLLDAELNEAQLRALPAGLPQQVEPMVLYSLAVKQLRAGRYADAAALLQGFIRRYDGQRLVTAAWSDDRWAFWDKVKGQQRQAAELARLARAGSDPAARYDQAALMYHDEFLFYNHLWGGSRQSYMMLDALLALEGDFDPVHTRWVAESNNYVQAIAAFEQLEGSPAPIAEKAAYSRAMALSRLYGFGREVALWRPLTDIRKDALQGLENFVSRYPKSDLAPEALLSLGYQTGNPAYFDRLRREYPRSDTAAGAPAKAEAHWADQAFQPFRYIDLADAPPAVADKARAVAGKGGTEVIAAGDWTYIVAGVSGMNQVELFLWQSNEGITVRVTPLAHTPGPGVAIARIPATNRTVR